MTSRRNFLKGSAALAAGAALPLSAIADPSPAAFSAAREAFWAQVTKATNDYFLVFVHPDQFDDIQRIYAPEKWRGCWSKYRKDRRDGMVGELAPREILDRYCTARAELIEDELGVLDHFKFITE